MDYLKELTAIVGASNFAATGDERWLKIAAQATSAAADGLKADNDRALHREPRLVQQRAIEQAIMSFRPDFLQAAEIVDALRASIERRGMPDEVRESLATYGQAFRDALDRADDEAEVRHFPDPDAQRENNLEEA